MIYLKMKKVGGNPVHHCAELRKVEMQGAKRIRRKGCRGANALLINLQECWTLFSRVDPILRVVHFFSVIERYSVTRPGNPKEIINQIKKKFLNIYIYLTQFPHVLF